MCQRARWIRRKRSTNASEADKAAGGAPGAQHETRRPLPGETRPPDELGRALGDVRCRRQACLARGTGRGAGQAGPARGSRSRSYRSTGEAVPTQLGLVHPLLCERVTGLRVGVREHRLLAKPAEVQLPGVQCVGDRPVARSAARPAPQHVDSDFVLAVGLHDRVVQQSDQLVDGNLVQQGGRPCVLRSFSITRSRVMVDLSRRRSAAISDGSMSSSVYHNLTKRSSSAERCLNGSRLAAFIGAGAAALAGMAAAVAKEQRIRSAKEALRGHH